jgi:hypothetical protein
MSDVVPTSENSTDSSSAAGIGHLFQLAKENPIPVMLGVLIAQQMGWLTYAATELHGVCF